MPAVLHNQLVARTEDYYLQRVDQISARNEDYYLQRVHLPHHTGCGAADYSVLERAFTLKALKYLYINLGDKSGFVNLKSS